MVVVISICRFCLAEITAEPKNRDQVLRIFDPSSRRSSTRVSEC